MVQIRLLDRQSIREFEWPEGTEYERNYLLPIITKGSKDFISNIQTEMQLLQLGDHLFPVTVNHTEYDNAYTSSPYTAYISYAKQEMGRLHNKPLEIGMNGIINLLSPILKWGEINHVASVNNWLLSTNLYPDWQGKHIKQTTDCLVSAFPKHVIMFRSLNSYSNSHLIDAMLSAGYILIPFRQVFIFDNVIKPYMNTRNMEIDRKILKKTSYPFFCHNDVSSKDYATIAKLYYLLYFGKYSTCAPLFTEKFIGHCHQNKLFNFQGLRDHDGEIIGIVGSFLRNNTLATPLVGYNTQLPLEEGLFRMITALAILEAYDNGYSFNISSGVSQFKRMRGATPYMEYIALYLHHLPFKRRVIWNILHYLMNHIGVPLIEKYQF